MPTANQDSGAHYLRTTYQPTLVAGDAFIAENATVLGDVRIGPMASVWFGAVVRGDTEFVQIGSATNVQDLSVLHADPGFPCRLGSAVTVGHAAVVHGATVHDGALIGIRAVVLNGATVGAGSIIGAGAVVTEGTEIPAGKLAVGVPAKVVRDVTPEDVAKLKRTAEHYVQAARQYSESLHCESLSQPSPRCRDE